MAESPSTIQEVVIMIAVTDLQGRLKYINAEMIECLEVTPDTQVVLTNGHRFYAKESPDEIAEKIVAYRQECLKLRNLEVVEKREKGQSGQKD